MGLNVFDKFRSIAVTVIDVQTVPSLAPECTWCGQMAFDSFLRDIRKLQMCTVHPRRFCPISHNQLFLQDPMFLCVCFLVANSIWRLRSELQGRSLLLGWSLFLGLFQWTKLICPLVCRINSQKQNRFKENVYFFPTYKKSQKSRVIHGTSVYTWNFDLTVRVLPHLLSFYFFAGAF